MDKRFEQAFHWKGYPMAMLHIKNGQHPSVIKFKTTWDMLISPHKPLQRSGINANQTFLEGV